MTREEIGAATRRFQRPVTWTLTAVGVVLAVYFLVVSAGRSPDPMLTPLGSRLDYMITAPAMLAYFGVLYAWGVWLAIFTAPRKEVVAALSTVLTGLGLFLWALDISKALGLVLLTLGMAHGILMIGQALHRERTNIR
ncbi:MAG TPA: hypothetical protein VGN09_28160 [Vicinamibacteria bacterium]